MAHMVCWWTESCKQPQRVRHVGSGTYGPRPLRPVPHPGSVGLALVAKGKDEDDGQDSEDDGEQDPHVVMWLKSNI